MDRTSYFYTKCLPNFKQLSPKLTKSVPISSQHLYHPLDLNRPLPPLPPPDEPQPPTRRVGSFPPSAFRLNSVSSPIKRMSMSSPIPSGRHSLLMSLVRTPNILAAVAKHLPDWSDLCALLNTSRQCRNIMSNIELRDVVLARFVPAYSDALNWRDMANYQDIPVTIHDLHLLLISQQLGLHRYPMHAVRILVALYPTIEDDWLTHKFIQLTQAYSRFVLLLQAMVHSSSLPVPLYEEENSPKHPVRPPRQLTFPAPLAYLHYHHRQEAPVSKRSKHHSLPLQGNPTDSTLPHVRLTVRPSADRLSSMILTSATNDVKKLNRKRSLFKKSSSNINNPPPPEEPRALRLYSGSWRKCMHSGKIASQPEFWDGSIALKLPDDGALKQPPLCIASANDSSDSSAPVSPTIAYISLPRTGDGSCRSTPTLPSIFSRAGSSLPLSPHDLTLATCRVRAPVLRVFVPCAEMETRSSNVLACEEQLVEAGLWKHLSTGDIVCNLGYVPPAVDDIGPLDTEEDTHSILPLGNRNANNNNEFRKWLLFDGHCLVPFMPPSVVPIKNPLMLPSPFYYNHLIPGSSRQQGNMRFIINKFPPVDNIPQLELVNVARRVPSTHASTGWVEVKKWAWTARVVRTKPSPHSPLLMSGGEFVQGEAIEMGDGWNGEWVFEGEGTKEGRQALLDTINGLSLPGGPKEWELVRKRSGGGILWLRLTLH